MAITRKFLTAMGIDADKADEIITAHTETLNEIKAERDKLREDAEKLPEALAELKKWKEEAAKHSGEDQEARYQALQKEYEDYKASVSKKETVARKQEAYRALLREAGVAEKRLDAVLRVTDLESLELDQDGKLKEAEKLTERIRSEWADFIQTAGVKGVQTPNPPSGSGGPRMTKEEIYAIKDAEARQKAILENHELFGI